jgi:hypothetical protein
VRVRERRVEGLVLSIERGERRDANVGWVKSGNQKDQRKNWFELDILIIHFFFKF